MSPDASRVARYLESRAKKHGLNGVVYYNKLASDLGLPPVTDAWLSHPLSGIFDELDNEDDGLKRPFRTALVITEKTKFPGDGFWAMALRLRSPKKTKFSEKEMLIFYTTELQDLAKFYK
jgi:hypothetical protein